MAVDCELHEPREGLDGGWHCRKCMRVVTMRGVLTEVALLRHEREEGEDTLTTLRAENERLREVLSRIGVTLCVYESGSTVCGTVYPQCNPCLARAALGGG